MTTFQDFYGRYPSVTSMVGFLIVFFLCFAASFVLRWFWKHVLVRMARKSSPGYYLFTATTNAAQILFIAAGFSFCYKLFGSAALAILDSLPLQIINTTAVQRLTQNLSVLLLMAATVLLVWRAIFSIFTWYETEIAPKTRTRLDEKIVPSFRKVMKIIILVFVAMYISDYFGLELNKLWAAAGIGSLAVALAAKDTFANIISGVIILIDRPFLIGDRIELADGTFGDVVDIGLRSTRILSFDNTLHILPNADISNQRVTNHAYPDFKIKVRHNIGVAYGTDLEKVKGIINGILAEHPDVLNEPEWGIYFMEFGDSSLNLLVIYWVSNYTDKFRITDKINMRINTRFLEEGIEIPFPQRDVHMR